MARRLDPNNRDAYPRHGYSYNSKGEYDPRHCRIHKPIELSPTTMWLTPIRRRGLLQQRQYDRAIENYDRALKIKPDYAMAVNGADAFAKQSKQ